MLPMWQTCSENKKGTTHATFAGCNGKQTSPNMSDLALPPPATSCHTDFFPQLHFKQNPLGFFALTAVTHIRITHTQSVPFPTKYE